MDQDALNAALHEGENEQVDSIAQTPAVEKIKVGEKEYTQEELSQLVSLGEVGRELETKWNTKIDRIMPEFTKKSQRLAEVEKEYEQIKANSIQSKTNAPESEEQAIREAKEAAKKLGIVTTEDFKDLMAKNYKEFYEQERAAEKLLEGANKYETEIDGSDGRPKFEKIAVLEFMRDNGVSDMMTAYKIMHEEALDAWKESQLGKVKKPAISTGNSSTAGFSKKPEPVKITSKNLLEQVNAVLNQE